MKKSSVFCRSFAVLLCFLTLLSVCCSCSSKAAGTGKESHSLTYNGVRLAPDMDMATVLSSLKETYQYSESPSCAFEGLDKAYVFAHIRVETYPKDGKDLISGIYLKDDKISVYGVTIGTPVSEMKEKLGTPTTQASETIFFYTAKDGSVLKCISKDGALVAVQILSKEVA